MASHKPQSLVGEYIVENLYQEKHMHLAEEWLSCLIVGISSLNKQGKDV